MKDKMDSVHDESVIVNADFYMPLFKIKTKLYFNHQTQLRGYTTYSRQLKQRNQL